MNSGHVAFLGLTKEQLAWGPQGRLGRVANPTQLPWQSWGQEAQGAQPPPQWASSLSGPSLCVSLWVGILEPVAIPFSRGSSPPRDRTQGSCIADGFFASWASREAHISPAALSKGEPLLQPAALPTSSGDGLWKGDTTETWVGGLHSETQTAPRSPRWSRQLRSHPETHRRRKPGFQGSYPHRSLESTHLAVKPWGYVTSQKITLG